MKYKKVKTYGKSKKKVKENVFKVKKQLSLKCKQSSDFALSTFAFQEKNRREIHWSNCLFYGKMSD